MPLQATSGAASYDGFGGGVAAVPTYIEDIFGTFLYTGNVSTQTITNGIDLAGKGGLVWTKSRSTAQVGRLYDSARGTQYDLIPSLTEPQNLNSPPAMNFSSSGFGLVADNSNNQSGVTYASWTFRKQPKFFDVVTYTGNGTAGRTIAHNLGSAVGCLIVKCTSAAEDWQVWHRTFTGSQRIRLNTTDAVDTSGGVVWNGTAPTSTVFTVGDNGVSNGAGQTYVAYLFAHNAGGFGLTGTDNVISCGSYTGNGSATTGPYINLGYEPQWLLLKSSSNAQDWYLFDNMRGLQGGVNASGTAAVLYPNGSYAEGTANCVIDATGFRPGNVGINTNGATYIYIAIRRGPMKVPTSGASVYTGVTRTGTGATANITSIGFPTDLVMSRDRQSADADFFQFFDRLRGPLLNIKSTGTLAETSAADSLTSFASMNGFSVGADTGQNGINRNTSNYVYECFRRAPSFFDVVCYTGNGSSPGQTLNHNLNAVPELIIWKARSNGVNNWYVYNATVGTEFYVELNTTIAKLAFSLTGSRTPTSSVFYTCTGGDSSNNGNNITYVAYLFATCAGVSKCFSYTGNGSSQTINCGFTGGARFVLIKRTDSTGDWYVWDTARGIVSANDPHLSLNASNAEVTTDDTIDTDSTGFVVNQVSATNVNVSSATYIGIAIA